jgi:hypothetical protein
LRAEFPRSFESELNARRQSCQPVDREILSRAPNIFHTWCWQL